MATRKALLPIVMPVYEHEWSERPEKVRISFEDGKVFDYAIIVPQPKPVLARMVDAFTDTCYGGYKYKEKGIRKRRGDRYREKDV